MKEKQGNAHNGLEAVSTGLEPDEIRKLQYMKASLEEILSDAYMRISSSDSTEETNLTMKALRIIRIHEGHNRLLTIGYCSPEFADKRSQLIKAMRKETDGPPLKSRRIPKEQEQLALNTLKETGLRTVACTMLWEGEIAGKPLFTLHLPKVFMNVDPSFPPSRKGDLAIAIARHFLTKVPFK